MSLIDKLAKKLRTPREVQTYLRKLPYNREERGETLRSAEQCLKVGKAHCLEAAFLAAAILEKHGYPPTVLSFESQDGLDHVIFVYKEKNRWGAIARSRDEGLHGRPPIYRSLRDLAWSYFDPYVDSTGRITAFQIAHLDDSKANWRLDKKHVWKTETYLLKLKHRPLTSSDTRYKKLLKAYKANGPMKAKNFGGEFGGRGHDRGHQTHHQNISSFGRTSSNSSRDEYSRAICLIPILYCDSSSHLLMLPLRPCLISTY